MTRCGQALPPEGPRPHVASARDGHRPCPRCALIARRPISVPGDPWVPSPPLTPGSQPAPAGQRETVRVAWARCGLDGRLHLLTARAVLDIATLGCALACCGALVLTPRLVLRGVGTPCGGCLAVGSV